MAIEDQETYLRHRVKAELRKQMRALRRTAPPGACAQRSARIVASLEELSVFASARSVALFWPIEERHEVDLRPLHNTLRARGARIAYPSIDPETGGMTFRFVSDPDELVEAGYGFREPPGTRPEACAGELEAIVVPALAVDPKGYRIGYGVGYYDRTLPRFSPPATTIAVAYDYQLVPEVPATEGDVAVGWVVTDGRVLRATPNASEAADEGGAILTDATSRGGPAWASPMSSSSSPSGRP